MLLKCLNISLMMTEIFQGIDMEPLSTCITVALSSLIIARLKPTSTAAWTWFRSTLALPIRMVEFL